MHWLLALVGAVLGSMTAGIDGTFFGLVIGAMVGWQGSRIAQLRRRIETLERSGPQPASVPLPRPVAAPVRPAPVVAPAAPDIVAPEAEAQAARAAVETPTPAPTTTPAASVGERAVFEAREPAAATPRPATPRSPGVSIPTGTAAQTAMPRAPAEPTLGERAFAAVKGWFFSGNVPVKLGMLVLFFGVAAALKYAVDQGYVAFPIELRLAAIAAVAMAGLVWGWRNRSVRPAFGLSLQGGAIGVLLLTIFAGFKLYGLLPAGVAFALIVVLVAGAAMLAVLQNAVALAVLGFVGGYLAPVLISTGSGNYVALFSYYAVLNAAVFGIAWKRPWRALNLVGFAFTFIVGTMWGAKYYRPENFATVEPFLILFFLFYVAIAVLYALRGPAGRKPFVDGTLIFGTPLIAFPLQAAMLQDDRMGLAFSALAVAFLYAALARWLWRREGIGLLAQSFAALAVGFATLAVPLALSARATSASWALEGAALVWLGLRQRRWLPQLTGWALQAFAAMAYLASIIDHGGWQPEAGEMAIVNGHALVVLLMAVSAYFISWLHERAGSHRLLVWLAFALGTFWWLVAGLREMVEHFGYLDASVVFLVFSAITAVVAASLRGLVRWPRLGYLVALMALCGIPLAVLTLVEFETALRAPMAGWWLLWFAAIAFGLWRLRDPEQRGISIAHVATLGTAALLYGASLHEEAVRAVLDDGWRFVASFVPLIALLVATWRVPAIGAWPLADRFDRYRLRWFAPALTVLAIAWIAALGERGGSYPLPYLPVVNPVELFQLALLLVAIRYARQHGSAADSIRVPIAGACFLFVTFAGLRAVHHYTGVAYTPAILDDRIAQAVLTVLWSIAGVTAWIYGSRRRLWNVWLTGAILMGVVLAKLVIIDRQYVGNLAGIVSFMAVGALLVLVGRIAPTPPRERVADAGDEATADA
jgi:uncharacterized membrane protein